MNPEHIERFEEALYSDQPGKSLYESAVALRDGGMSQVDLYELFMHFFLLVQKTSPDDDTFYDAIADNMDLICGGPWAKGGDLYPTQIG